MSKKFLKNCWIEYSRCQAEKEKDENQFFCGGGINNFVRISCDYETSPVVGMRKYIRVYHLDLSFLQSVHD